MDISGLQRETFEVWTPFLDGKVKIRYVSRAELFTINSQATRNTWDKGHQLQKEHDPIKADIFLGRAAVKGWEGFTMNGEAYPYTEQNCDFLMGKWVDFARFVNEICIDLQALMDAEAAAEEKK
ncbi:MAG: hypothetical protein LBQ00_06840 [Syntrophobacterales bacterium]|jgi:hypothetical protein|nr:hypothetical protein [Syntrophobacterales bacterium]